MGYRLETVMEQETPYDDPVTITGMDRLIKAAKHAGVDLETIRIRTWETGGNKRHAVRASLRDAFSTNDGWWIRPEEAEELAKKLPKVAWGSDDPQFIEEMAQYFAYAAKKGGAYVW